MVKKTSVPAVFLMLLLAQLLGAQSNTALSSYYNSELVQVGYDLRGLTLSYRNQTVATAFALPRNLTDVLYSYPDTKAFAQSYSRLNLGGNLLLFAALGAVVAAPIPLLLWEADPSGTLSGLARGEMFLLGFTIGGAVSSSVAAVLKTSALNRLCRGVAAFNRHKIGEYR